MLPNVRVLIARALFAIFQPAAKLFFHFLPLSINSAVIIVFDITKPSTFHTVKNWKEDVEVNVKNRNNKEPPIFIVVGNKSDLSAERQVTAEEAQTLASSLGMDYYETSAKDGVGINEMVDQLSQALLKRLTALDE